VLRIDPAFTATGFVATESYKDHRFKEQLAEDLVQAGLPA